MRFVRLAMVVGMMAAAAYGLQDSPSLQPADPAPPPVEKPDPAKEPAHDPAAPADSGAPNEIKAAAPPAVEKPSTQNEKPGSELFVAASEAIKRAQAITYHAKAYAVGAMFEPNTAKIEADVKMLRSPTAGTQTSGWLIRSTGSGTPKATADTINFDVMWTGNNIQFISHADKKVIEKRQPREAKNQAFQVATSSRNDELSSARPFAKELGTNADYELLDKQTVDGVECDVIVVTFGEKKVAKTRWSFATTDHLPRKVERLIEGTMANGSMILELTKVHVDESKPPALTPDAFKIQVPDGYANEELPKISTTPPATHIATPSGEKIEVPAGKTPEVKQPANPEPPASEAKAEPEAPPPAPAAPTTVSAFDLRSSSGDHVTLESLRGNVLVVEFGGSWCLPCRDSRTELDSLAQKFRDKPVKVLAMSVRDKSPDAAIDRFKQKSYSFPLLVEADLVAKSWGVKTFPTYVVVGLNEEIVKIDGAYAKGTTVQAIGDAVESYFAAKSGTPLPPKAEPVLAPTPAKKE